MLAVFLAGGGFGVYRYLANYWFYRGFAPSHDPAYVTEPGTSETLRIASPAVGGRRQEVVVYLPSGYGSHPARRYPVLYLLHGWPGTPSAFLHELRLGVIDDMETARGKARPLILVMPYGSTGVFTDKEWANGYGRNEDWETFLAHDVVRAIDARYRTIASGRGRAVAGLSEGGYGAINVALHHPGEFDVVESWSGYEVADRVRSVFGPTTKLLAWNSPDLLLPSVAGMLRRHHTFVWFYTGTKDGLRAQNGEFAHELAVQHIAHRYFVASGGHDWSVWRRYAPDAYLVAARHLRG